MKFRCENCKKEWYISREKLVYMKNWSDSCPDCGSTELSYEIIEKVIMKIPSDL